MQPAPLPQKSANSVGGYTSPGRTPTTLGADTTGPQGINSPLMSTPGNAGIGAGGGPPLPPDTSYYWAKALYPYTASPDDPDEISFSQGEILDIIDTNGKWWQARREDGTLGFVPSNHLQALVAPSNYLQTLGGGLPLPADAHYKAQALYAYTASPDDPNEISFSKGEILDIIDDNGGWWQTRKKDGTFGIAPSNHLQVFGGELPLPVDARRRAKALYAYTASPDEPHEISFSKGEILDTIDKSMKWWQVLKEDGTLGIAPSSYLQALDRAQALYAYTASPDDPNEISFSKGEILDIIDNNGKWWQVRKEDGTLGIAPLSYLQVLDPFEEVPEILTLIISVG